MNLLYQCEFCEEIFGGSRRARACEAEGVPDPTVEVGDIVFTQAGFTWCDGEKKWVSNPGVLDRKNPAHGNCFGECCSFQFYYVVTHIDNDGHRLRYHVVTGAMTDDSCHNHGYTYDNGSHCTPRKVRNPPKRVVAASKTFIGFKSDRLL